jgi:hypothetical protein
MQRTAHFRSPSPRGPGRRVVATPPASRDRTREERSRRINAVADAFARIRSMHRGRG